MNLTANRFPTRVAIPPERRAPIIDELNVLTASTVDLYSQVKQAHWNIKGPHFVSRHELFDSLADHLRTYGDSLAERVSMLGGYAAGTIRMAASSSILPEYDTRAVDGRAHIQCLVDRYETLATRVRNDIRTMAEIGEPASEDLLVQMLRGLEADLWFLESHGQV